MCAQSLVLRHPLHVKEQERRIPGVHFVEMSIEEPEMIETIRYYLAHDEERKEIAYNGRLWYERNWSPIAQAYFIMNRCLEVMKEPHKVWQHGA